MGLLRMNGNQILSFDDISIITTAVIMGTFARIWILKEDYRQYPSYPNGYLIHIIIGFVASALGAVAIPALLSKNYTAVTFLTVALQQFRDVPEPLGIEIPRFLNNQLRRSP